MRNGKNQQRMRGRNRKGQNPLTRVYESNGPDVKVRGTASHVAEKYLQLARDATSSGDPVGAESYYQHAEHYFRLIAAVNEQFRQNQQQFGDQGQYDDGEDDGPESGEPYAPREPYQQQQDQREFQQRDHQQREQREHRGNRENQPREAREHQPREQRDHQQRDHQPREQRDNRFPPRERGEFQPREAREHQPRESREQRDQQPRHQPRPQPPVDDSVLEQLPAFVTGGMPVVAAPAEHEANGADGANGFDAGAADRFPLHRRRRRRHNGPRDNAGGSDTEGAAQD